MLQNSIFQHIRVKILAFIKTGARGRGQLFAVLRNVHKQAQSHQIDKYGIPKDSPTRQN
jgi:hypothetical protein